MIIWPDWFQIVSKPRRFFRFHYTVHKPGVVFFFFCLQQIHPHESTYPSVHPPVDPQIVISWSPSLHVAPNIAVRGEKWWQMTATGFGDE